MKTEKNNDEAINVGEDLHDVQNPICQVLLFIYSFDCFAYKKMNELDPIKRFQNLSLI